MAADFYKVSRHFFSIIYCMKGNNKNLTKREMEVLKLLVEGLSNQEIAEKLGVSFFTSKAHLESIYKKLSVQNRLQAAIFAVINKLVDPPKFG